MKSWPGEPDGDLEGLQALADGEVVGFAAHELSAPNVYVEGNRMVMLVRMEHEGPEADIPVADVETILTADFEASETFEIDVPSGALVLSVQYNATPEVGAPVGHLSDLCFFDGCPRLPPSVPDTVTRLVTTEDQLLKESMVVPLAPGRYRVQLGEVADFERFDIRSVV